MRSALLVTLVCLLLGYPAAIALARARGAVQALLLLSVILPLSVGVVVKAYAWQIVLRRDGVVSQVLVGSGSGTRRSGCCSPRPASSWAPPTSSCRS